MHNIGGGWISLNRYSIERLRASRGDLDAMGKRYLAYCLAKRHGATRTIQAILVYGSCYDSILDIALEELGERRLVAALSKRIYADFAAELLTRYHKELSSRSRSALAKYASHTSHWVEVEDILFECSLGYRARRPLIARIATSPTSSRYALRKFGNDRGMFAILSCSRRERRILERGATAQ